MSSAKIASSSAASRSKSDRVTVWDVNRVRHYYPAALALISKDNDFLTIQHDRKETHFPMASVMRWEVESVPVTEGS